MQGNPVNHGCCLDGNNLSHARPKDFWGGHPRTYFFPLKIKVIAYYLVITSKLVDARPRNPLGGHDGYFIMFTSLPAAASFFIKRLLNQVICRLA